MDKQQSIGTGIALGLCFGAALWLTTDNVVFLSVGLIFGIVFGGMFGTTKTDSTDDEHDGPTDPDEPPAG